MLDRSLQIKELQLLTLQRIREQEPIFAYNPCAHPERNQLAFHRSKDMVRLVTGGNQSGKSLCAAAEVAYQLLGCHPYQTTPPNPRWFCLSAVYRTVLEGIWRHLNPISRELNAGAGFIPAERILKTGPKIPGYDIPSYLEILPIGTSCVDQYGNKAASHRARIDFLSAEGGQSARRRVQAAAVDGFAIDEEVEEILWNEIKMRLLVRGGRITISCTMVQSEQWLVDIEDRALQGLKGYHIVRLNTDFNEHIKPEVRDQVYAGMSDEEQKIRRLGLSRASQGQVYPEFDGSHVVEPFKIPDSWPKFQAMDPGFRTFAALWLAINPDTCRGFLYREMYLRNTNLDAVAQFIYEAEGLVWDFISGAQTIGPETEIITNRWIDPSAFSHSAAGEIGVGIQLASKYGINTTPAQNNVIAGIETVKSWMKPGLVTPGVNGESRPMIQVFSNLVEFLGERRRYKFKEDSMGNKKDSKKDRPVKKGDHLMDSWRYLAMGIMGTGMSGFLLDKVTDSKKDVSDRLKEAITLNTTIKRRANVLTEIDRHINKFFEQRAMQFDEGEYE